MFKQIKLKGKQAGLTAVEYAVAGAVIVGILVSVGLAFGPLLIAKFNGLLTP